MLEPQIVQAMELLDLMLEHFADDGHWTRGRYNDGNGGHCLVGALLHLSRKHRLPRAPAIALLQDVMGCRMFAAAIGAVQVDRRRRRETAERAVVANIDP